jgi:hypothetical protein
MRIVLENGANIDGPEWTALPFADAFAIGVHLREGRYQVVGADVVEPIECHDDQETALARMLDEHARTRHPHKVILNLDIHAD